MPRARRADSLSAAAARRIALAAQGLDRPRPSRTGPAAVRALFDRVQIVQIDSVNVLARSQELPLWARLGAHDRTVLPRAVERRELFEYWAHEASLVPVALHPLLRWRMEASRRGEVWTPLRVVALRPDYIAGVLDEVRRRGALAASELSDAATHRKRGSWWSWGDHKRAIEYLFWCGDVTPVRRTSQFERVYDLPERVLPPAVLAAPTPAPRDAQRALLELAGRALGIATAADLADYFRIKKPIARPLVAELAENGTFIPVKVEGWREPAFLHHRATVGDRAEAATLLSPFDSLVWDRARTERMFGFRYRIEIYTPAPQRVFGYYVLPFLLGDALVARVCLKSDREGSALRVNAAHVGPDAPPAVAERLAAELRAMAAWLGLERVEVGRRGNLGAALRSHVRTGLRRARRRSPRRAAGSDRSPRARTRWARARRRRRGCGPCRRRRRRRA